MPHLTLTPDETLYFSQSTDLDERPPLVLIHGAGGDGLHWPPALRHETAYPVLALDLPGHGRSTGRARASIGAYATVVLAWLNTLAIPRAILAGHSMGGAVVQQIALDHPDRCAGLGLVSTSARLRVAPQLLTLLDDPGQFEAAVEMVVQGAYGANAPAAVTELGRKRMLAVAPDVLAADFRACDVFDVRAQIGAWTGATLILVGENDQMTPAKFSAWLAGQLPNAHLQVFDGAGHMLPLERMEAVTSALLDFARSIEG